MDEPCVEIRCLGSIGACVVLHVESLCLVVDVALPTDTLLHFRPPRAVASERGEDLPEGAADGAFSQLLGRVQVTARPRVNAPPFAALPVEDVDAVLVSSAAGMAALPFLRRHRGFRARVFATEPAIQLARLAMTEMVQSLRACSFAEPDEQWQRSLTLSLLKGDHKQQLDGAWRWQPLYSQDEVKAAVAGVEAVSFHETIRLYNGISLLPCSSGFEIGAVNWAVCTASVRVVVLSEACAYSMRHPAPLDRTVLHRSPAHCPAAAAPVPTIAIVRSVRDPAAAAADTAVTGLLAVLGRTVSKGGNVLIPVSSFSLVFDLVEQIRGYLDSMPSLVDAPIALVGSTAAHALKYAAVFSEWLSAPRQERAQEPAPPFDFAAMQRRAQLHVFADATEMLSARPFHGGITGAVVLAAHPSLRFGEALNFVRIFRDKSSNALIHVEPGVDFAQALAPFRPMAMQTHSFPLDFRLTPTEACALARDAAADIVMMSAGADLDEAQCRALGATLLPLYGALSVPVKQKFVPATMHQDLSAQLRLQHRTGRVVCPLSARLNDRDYDHLLYPSEKESARTVKDLPATLTARPDPTQLARHLKRAGFSVVRDECDAATGLVRLRVCEGDVVLELAADRTSICAADEAARATVARAVAAYEQGT